MRTRCVALVTRDPALYADLAGLLRERHIPSVSLLPGQRIPGRAAVVLTSPSEVSEIHHPRVVPVADGGDRESLWVAVESALTHTDDRDEMVVGIDPGPRPGYAIVSAGHVLSSGSLANPEEAGELAAHLHRRFPHRPIRFRVGDGDRIARNRILNALALLRRPIELVDEQGTTPRGHRRPRDLAAAREIARSPGRPVRGRQPLTMTRGDIQNLQRLSREGSGGKFTISAFVAAAVLRGEITLGDALADGQRRLSTAAGELPRSRQPS
ncbi:MAG: hypothetical protein L3K19_01000 [Thermoplasmata archaeon]|nr:hypothetical protein [Thermoplasmata archaeon]